MLKITFEYTKGTLKYPTTLRVRLMSDNPTKDIPNSFPQNYPKDNEILV